MKKLFFIFTLLFVLSACSKATNIIDENSAPAGLNNYNDSDVVEKLNKLRNEDLPQSKEVPSQNTPEVNLENLFGKYNAVVMKTNQGDITIKLYGEESPMTVNNFLNLAQKGFYNGTKFHRVIPAFMIQGGDPNSKDDDWSDDGIGGPGYKFADEFNNKKLLKGSLAMANSGPNTNGSQFFIVTTESTPWLDGKHTNFGEVISGMEVVETIEAVKTDERAHPLEDMTIISMELININ